MELSRCHVAFERMTDERDGPAAPPPSKQRKLLSVPEAKNPRFSAVRIERGIDAQRHAKGGQIDADEDAEGDPERGVNETPHLLSSANRFLAVERLGSLSSARSSICTAFALSP